MSHITPDIENREVIICIDGKKFRFDIKKLMEGSSYFDKMFGGPYRENTQHEIVLEQVDAEAFHIFRDFLLEIGTSFIGIDPDMLLRLLILADRLLLHTLREECHKYIQFWLENEITFPCKVLETYLLIGDMQLKETLVDWLYKTQLQTPETWTWNAIYRTQKAVEKFGRKFKVMTEGAPEEVVEELDNLLMEHWKMILAHCPEIQGQLNEAKERLDKLQAKFDALAPNSDNANTIDALEKEREHLGKLLGSL